MRQIKVKRSGMVSISRVAAAVLLALVVGGCVNGRRASEPETLNILGAIQNYESRNGRLLCDTIEADVRIRDEDEVYARYTTRDASPFGNQNHVRRAAKLTLEDGQWQVHPDPLGAMLGG